MLKIDANPQFETTVTVNTAAIKGSFIAVFNALPTDELEALDTGEPGAWRNVLRRVVHITEPFKVGDQVISGDQPEGRAAALEKLIRWPGVGAAMLKAYYGGLWGEAQGN